MVSTGSKVVCCVVVALALVVCGGMNAAATAVDVVGLWEGAITVQGSELGIAITFAAGDSGLTGTIDIPAQQAKGMPLTNIKLDSTAISFDMPDTPGDPKFAGVVAVDGKKITGDFMQSGGTFTFALTKAVAEAPDSTVAAKVNAPPKIKIEPEKAVKKEKTVAVEYTTNPSGLQWRDLVVGEGDLAKSGQTVDVHYTGWLYADGKKGTKFDSSVDRGKPFSFPLGQGRVIKGWDEGVAGMKIGGKRELLIPPDMGYGSQGTPGGPIPPNATLLFEVELLGIQ